MHSLAKVTDPEKTGSGGTELATILELNNSKIVDPTDDPAAAQLAVRGARPAAGRVHRRDHPDRLRRQQPVGTGPFAYQHFVPGQLSQFARHENYWDGPAWVDELFIYDFADDAAKVNALLAGQVQSVDNLPNYLAGTIEQQGASPLVSETGAWVPFTMRVDVAAVLRRAGAAGAAADRGPAADDRPGAERVRGARQRHVLPVRPGLRQGPAAAHAGHRPGQVAARPGRPVRPDVELVTSTAVGAGAVESANLFVEQARLAGVDGAAEQGRRQRLLRRPVPELELRPGLLEHPQLHPAGGRVLGRRAPPTTRPTSTTRPSPR